MYSFKSTSSDEDRSALVSVINKVVGTRQSSNRISLKKNVEVTQEPLNENKPVKRKSVLVDPRNEVEEEEEEEEEEEKEDEENEKEDEDEDNGEVEEDEDELLNPEKELKRILADLEFIKLNKTVKTAIQIESICFECMQSNEDLIKCTGLCLRSVHLDCAGLIEEPLEGFKCNECNLNSFNCFICKKNGSTKKCSLNECYRYYHDECIKKNDHFHRDINGKFTCALHLCATCISEAHKFKPEFDHNEATVILQPFKGTI